MRKLRSSSVTYRQQSPGLELFGALAAHLVDRGARLVVHLAAAGRGIGERLGLELGSRLFTLARGCETPAQLLRRVRGGGRLGAATAQEERRQEAGEACEPCDASPHGAMLHSRAASCPTLRCASRAPSTRWGRPRPKEGEREPLVAYEILLMLDAELAEPRQAEIIDRVKTLVEKGGGSWQQHVPWGKRRLAYEIAHK